MSECCGYEMLEVENKRGALVGYICTICHKPTGVEGEELSCELCGEKAIIEYDDELLCSFHYDQAKCDGQGLL